MIQLAEISPNLVSDVQKSKIVNTAFFHFFRWLVASYIVPMRLVVAILSLVAPSSGDPVTVTTTLGAVLGSSDGSVNSFLGIPFATPPLGNLRSVAVETKMRVWEG